MSLEERGVLLTAKHLAEVQFDEKVRRDGNSAIKHPRAVAKLAGELGLSPVAQAIAWDHDIPEDCGMSAEEVGAYFGPIYGPKITFGLIALTFLKGTEAVEEYFDRIAKAAETDWEIAVIKVIDRRHFHSCPYGDPRKSKENREKEIAKAIETLTVFKEMCSAVRQYIPETFLGNFDELVSTVLSLAQTRLNVLGHKLA